MRDKKQNKIQSDFIFLRANYKISIVKATVFLPIRETRTKNY